MGRVSLKCGVIRLPRLFFVTRASVFRRNRIKKPVYFKEKHSAIIIVSIEFEDKRVENLTVFLVFIKVFYSILVSSLTVCSYRSRSSAEDFRAKSLCPGYGI